MRLDHEGFADLHARAVARRKQAPGFADGQADRLLAQDMLPCLSGFDGPGHMQMIGQRVVNSLNFRVSEEFLVGTASFGNIELRCRLVRFARITFFTAIPATPSTPHWTFCPLTRSPLVVLASDYWLALVAYGLSARYRFSNSSLVQTVFKSVTRSMQRIPSRSS